MTRPGDVTRPSLPTTRPGGDRPSTLPSRPGGGDRPTVGDRPDLGNRPSRPGNRPDQLPSRPDFGNRPGIGDRPNAGDRPGGGNWWDNNRPGRGDINIGSGNNVTINRNFQNSINWSTNRSNWGYNPWWNRPAHYPWYGGSWRWGWARPPYYRPPAFPGYYYPGRAIAWGLVGWGLGNLFFNCGYYHYHNPYPVQTVYVQSTPSVTYQEPITVVAEAAAPQDESSANAQAEQVDSFIGESQTAFKANNYLQALELCDKAISVSPGDGGLHEYRALILFALAKYGEAAGVLNPVLVSSPGWDWSTMVQLYDKQETYAGQLRKLEEYTRANQESASACFVLGYHYMICGYMEESATAFRKAVELEPADRVAAQLASLAENSKVVSGDESSEVANVDPEKAEKAEESSEEPDETSSTEVTEAATAEVPFEQMLGTWSSDQGENGTVILTLKEEGTFTWEYTSPNSDPFKMEGNFNLGSDNILTLSDGAKEDSQMAGTVSLPAENQLNFVLAGGPPGDSGLSFKKG
ncbi:MAG: hypothetical protein AAF491_01190 [Verrucomicrobiota bacterium]